MHVRAQSYGLFRRDRWIAGAAIGLGSRTHHQHGFPAHESATLDFDDLQSAKSFGAVKTYGRSKLCNILCTRELARRLRDTGVTANCLHPGFVAARFADRSGGLISHLAWLAKFFAISPAEGAETIIYLASSPGQYRRGQLPAKRCAALEENAAVSTRELIC
jgi:NAD(P)-dependent dehydrogenase (short-subunit alcohol dehydrogenase family)